MKTNRNLKDYGHFHIYAMDDEYGMIMPVVTEKGDKHILDDWRGDLTGEDYKVIGEYDTAFEAVKVAINLIKKKFPKAEILYGAGQPPDDWLDEVLGK